MNSFDDEIVLSSSYTFCYACLSQHRRLSGLGVFVEIFKKICGKTDIQDQIMVCWECMALLRKAQRFHQRVLRAHLIECQPRSSLSTLKSEILQEDNKFILVAERSSSELNTTDTIPTQELILRGLNSDKSKSYDAAMPEVKQEILYDDKITFEYENMGIEKGEELIFIRETVLKQDLNFDESEAKAEKESLGYKQENMEDDRIKDNYSIGSNDYFEESLTLFDRKAENSTHVTKILKNRSKKYKKKYKWILNNDKISIKKIMISPEEVDQWRRKEEDTEYFKYAKFKCDSCIVGFVNEENWKKHNRIHHCKQYSSQCKICLQMMPHSKLDFHTLRHYCLYMCGCGYQCYTREHMNWHRKKFHHRKKVQCLECKHIFLSLSDFYQHFRLLHDVFICDFCEKRYHTKNHLIVHMRSHIFPRECKLCKNSKFSRYGAYRYHMRLKHNVDRSEPAYCVLCDKTFANELQYKSHVWESAAHRRERNDHRVKCPDCDKVFSCRSYMNSHHKVVHLKVSQHYCKECDKSFERKASLKTHNKRTHLGIPAPKIKTCSTCGRGFTTKSSLDNHMRIHTGERPFSCDICKATFTQKAAMTTHVKRVHLKIPTKSGRPKNKE